MKEGDRVPVKLYLSVEAYRWLKVRAAQQLTTMSEIVENLIIREMGEIREGPGGGGSHGEFSGN